MSQRHGSSPSILGLGVDPTPYTTSPSPELMSLYSVGASITNCSLNLLHLRTPATSCPYDLDTIFICRTYPVPSSDIHRSTVPVVCSSPIGMGLDKLRMSPVMCFVFTPSI